MFKLLIYSIAVTLLIVIGLVLIHKFVVEQEKKDKILKVSAVLTVVLHYSSLWVDYLQIGSATVNNTMLFPIYPCNICMWLLLILSFMKNKKSFFYKSSAEFLAIGGTLCGLIGLYANEIFLNNPNFFDYDSLKGLLSHSSMIFGTLFILTQGYVDIRAKSLTLSCTLGLTLFVIIGGLINLLFYVCHLEPVNAMFMLEFPFDIKGFNFVTIGLLGILLSFIIGNIFEFVFIKKEERWYRNLVKKEG